MLFEDRKVRWRQQLLRKSFRVPAKASPPSSPDPSMKSCSTSGARKSGFRLSFESAESGCGDWPYYAVKLSVDVEF